MINYYYNKIKAKKENHRTNKSALVLLEKV